MTEREPAPGPRLVGWALLAWTVVLGLATLVLSRFRDDLDEAHKTLVLLLVVLGASAQNGRAVGLAVAALAFLAFNFFLLPPYYTLRLADPLDWSVLLGFLVTGGLAAQLFHREQDAKRQVERRAREVERFADLTVQSLAAPTATDAVRTVAEAIRAELPVRSVWVFGLADRGGAPVLVARTPDGVDDGPDPGLLRFALTERRPVALETKGTTHVAPPDADLASLLVGTRSHEAVMIPLFIRDRPIGVVCIADPAGLSLDRTDAEFTDGLTRYAALALERLRLAGEAEHVAALRQADRLKDAFVASVSHDLRTPLTTIRALAAEMRDTEGERAMIIEQEAERLNRLVTDLLDLSSVRAGALRLDLQVIAAEDVIGAALQRLAGDPRSARIVVRLPSDGTLPVGRMDFVQTLRALANLLDNALRHAPGDEPVEVEVVVEGPSLLFRVLDRGPGIAEADRERVFEAFASGPAGGGQATGTGLGLAIARSLAEAQGGSVDYLAREGGGSAFVLRLPAETPPILG